MSLSHRIESWSSRVPFEPFVLVSSSGRTWWIATRECLTFDSSSSILNLLVRDESGWRDSHVRIAQVVAIERASTDLGPSDLRPTRPVE